MSEIQCWEVYDEATFELLGIFPTEDEALMFAVNQPCAVNIVPSVRTTEDGNE